MPLLDVIRHNYGFKISVHEYCIWPYREVIPKYPDCAGRNNIDPDTTSNLKIVEDIWKLDVNVLKLSHVKERTRYKKFKIRTSYVINFPPFKSAHLRLLTKHFIYDMFLMWFVFSVRMCV